MGGIGTVKDQDDFDRIVASLHQFSLDAGCWDETAALLAESFQAANHHLAVVGGDGSYLFGRMDFEGKPRLGLEQYFALNDFVRDERTPRIMALPHGRIVSGNALFTDHEKRTSYVYKKYFASPPEFPGRRIDQLFVRLDFGDAMGGWCLGRTDDTGDWTSGRIALMERLLPHVVQFVRVRQSLAKVKAWGVAFEELLRMPRHGLLLLDRRGAIMSANGHAQRIVSRRGELGERDGFLFAHVPADQVKLVKLLGEALPRPGHEPRGGSVTLARTTKGPPISVHVTPVTIDQGDYGARRVAALVRISDPGARTRFDPQGVGETLGLTPAQSVVAARLSEGMTVAEIAAATNRKESAVRSLLKQIYLRLGISRQVDLVRMVTTSSRLSRR